MSGTHRQKCRAISSSRLLTSEYVLSGRTGYSSSTGMYGGGTSNGSPSTVSLEAHTTLRTPAVRAAANTLYVAVMLFENVAAFVVRPGAGIAARCTTASTPSCRSSTAVRATVVMAPSLSHELSRSVADLL